MAIEAVLFDYSGVMTEDFAVPDGDLPFDRDALFLAMVGAMTDDAEPHPWHDLERGTITLDEFIAFIDDRVPGAGTTFSVDSEFNVMANLAVRPDRVALVRRLRGDGLRVGLLTNNVAEWAPLWRSRLPTDLFDRIIDSSDVGCRKPEAEIYRLALRELGDPPAERVMFIDDFEWNVEGALAVGMQGIHCTTGLDLDAAVDDARSSTS